MDKEKQENDKDDKGDDHAEEEEGELAAVSAQGSSSSSAAPLHRSATPQGRSFHTRKFFNSVGPSSFEDSSHAFMSEPSVSEDGGSSRGVKAPHRVILPSQQQQHYMPPVNRSLLSSDDDDSAGRVRRTPVHNSSQYQQNSPMFSLNTPNSPGGNTSLSSWGDSPAFSRKVFLQFPAPVRRSRSSSREKAPPGDQRTPGSGRSTPLSMLVKPTLGERVISGVTLPQLDYEDDGERPTGARLPKPLPPSDHDYSAATAPPSDSNRFSPTTLTTSSDSQRNRRNVVLTSSDRNFVRFRDSFSSLDDSFLPERRAAGFIKIRPTRSADEYQLGNSISSSLFFSVDSAVTPIGTHTREDSITMTLSDSDNETPSPVKQHQRPSLSSYHHDHADDEKTVDLRARARTRSIASISKPGGHRRTRSGDSAAAAFMMKGDKDWKGMEQDKIPLPSSQVDDDDESSHHLEEDGVVRASKRPQRQPRAPPNKFEKHQMYRQTRESGLHLSLVGSNDQVSPQTVFYGSQNAPLSPWSSFSIASDRHRTSKSPRPPPPPPPQSTTASTGRIGEESQMAWIARMSQLDSSNMNMDVDFSQSSNQSGNLPNQMQQNESSCHESDVDIREVSSSSNSDAANIKMNRMSMSQADHSSLAAAEEQYSDRAYRGSNQNVMRPRLTPLTEIETSPFANLGKASRERVARSEFLPTALLVEHDPDRYPTYICPRCGTRQREFFTVTDAPKRVEGPSAHLAVYCAIYVISSLFIFGLEEGWKPLDCIYFAVVTLTTAGLGDLVPTTSTNKLICSIFIYFGVACIGLLLGSYIANIMDERENRARQSRLENSCPNCVRLRTLHEHGVRSNRSTAANQDQSFVPEKVSQMHRFQSERSALDGVHPYEHHQPAILVHNHSHHHHNQRPEPHQHPIFHHSGSTWSSSSISNRAIRTPPTTNRKFVQASTLSDTSMLSPELQGTSVLDNSLLGSPVTRQILGRQMHTRHHSFTGVDMPGQRASVPLKNHLYGTDERELPFVVHPDLMAPNLAMEGKGMRRETPLGSLNNSSLAGSSSITDGESSGGSTTSTDSSYESLLDENQARSKTAKYVLLTIRRALLNSMIIIAVGSLGFSLIEGWSLVNSWYFTTVFLTT